MIKHFLAEAKAHRDSWRALLNKQLESARLRRDRSTDDSLAMAMYDRTVESLERSLHGFEEVYARKVEAIERLRLPKSVDDGPTSGATS